MDAIGFSMDKAKDSILTQAEKKIPQYKRRKPIAALLLSSLVHGFGQIYNGQLWAMLLLLPGK